MPARRLILLLLAVLAGAALTVLAGVLLARETGLAPAGAAALALPATLLAALGWRWLATRGGPS